MIQWKEIEGTKLLELTYDFTKSSKIIIPKDIENAIVRVNFVLHRQDYKQEKIESIIAKLKIKKPLLLFVGTIKIREVKHKDKAEKTLSLSLTRSELVSEFARLFAPKKLHMRIVKEAHKVMGEVNEN